ncbi:MAG: molecular chaperone DnaJ [bacterium]|nr:molecular chaperone DnaJ [bacterium]
MCNPRRVTITATRELDEAWQREVTRTARLSAEVVGEARVRQPLGSTLSRQALAALEMALAEDEAWHELDDGTFRHAVEGGYVVYHPDAQELEIVAVRAGRVEASGEATEVLEGRLQATVEVEGEGRYYDDGWGGRDETHARRDAEQQARVRLDGAGRDAVEEAAEQAEAGASDEVRARADEAAQAELERSAEAARAELEDEARGRLEAVGLRCRQAFHQVLARGYRDVLFAYARRQGAEIVTNHEDAGAVEIELQWSR